MKSLGIRVDPHHRQEVSDDIEAAMARGEM